MEDLTDNNEELVSNDVASQELEAWIEDRKISESQIDDLEQAKDILLDSLKSGDLTIEENGNLLQRLHKPLGSTDALNYKSRLTVADVQSVRGGDSSDAFNLMLRYGSALTGKSKTHLSKMDMSDFKVLRSVVQFFL